MGLRLHNQRINLLARAFLDGLVGLSLPAGELDEEVLNCVMHMSHPRDALIKSKDMKEDGNKEFRKGHFLMASKLYEQAL